MTIEQICNDSIFLTKLGNNPLIQLREREIHFAHIRRVEFLNTIPFEERPFFYQYGYLHSDFFCKMYRFLEEFGEGVE